MSFLLADRRKIEREKNALEEEKEGGDMAGNIG